MSNFSPFIAEAPQLAMPLVHAVAPGILAADTITKLPPDSSGQVVDRARMAAAIRAISPQRPACAP